MMLSRLARRSLRGWSRGLKLSASSYRFTEDHSHSLFWLDKTISMTHELKWNQMHYHREVPLFSEFSLNDLICMKETNLYWSHVKWFDWNSAYSEGELINGDSCKLTISYDFIVLHSTIVPNCFEVSAALFFSSPLLDRVIPVAGDAVASIVLNAGDDSTIAQLQILLS